MPPMRLLPPPRAPVTQFYGGDTSAVDPAQEPYPGLNLVGALAPPPPSNESVLAMVGMGSQPFPTRPPVYAPQPDTRPTAAAAVAANQQRQDQEQARQAAEADRLKHPPLEIQKPDIHGDYGGFGRVAGPVGQTSFNQANLNYYHPKEEGGGGGEGRPGVSGVSTFAPGPGSDYYAEEQSRLLRETMLKGAQAKAAYEAWAYSPVGEVKEGEVPVLGIEVAQQKQRESALKGLTDEDTRIAGLHNQEAEAWARNFGTSYASDPQGLQIKDKDHRDAYLRHLTDIKDKYEGLRDIARMRYLPEVMGEGGGGGGRFGAGYQSEMGKSMGRARGKQMAGGDDGI